MPNITIEGPVIKDVNKKRTLVKELTDAAAKAYSLPQQTIVVLIKENSPENVGVAGTLLIDRK
ncbi:MAG: 4-oxalocrotonate tautomerase DmpI [bacterium]